MTSILSAWVLWVTLIIFKIMFCHWYPLCKQWLIFSLHKLWDTPSTYVMASGKKLKVNTVIKSTNLSQRGATAICWGSLNKKTYSSILNFSNYILSNVVPRSSNCSDQKLCTYINWPANPMIPTFRLYAESLLLTYTTTYLLPHSNPLPSLLWFIAITAFLNILSAPNTQQSVLNWVARKVLLNISNISLYAHDFNSFSFHSL